MENLVKSAHIGAPELWQMPDGDIEIWSFAVIAWIGSVNLHLYIHPDDWLIEV